MGMKQIWDGEQLPPVGCEVLIHLASLGRWVPHTVSGYDIQPHLDGDDAYHRIFITLDCGHGIVNQRLLRDVRPIHWREEA